MACLKKIWDHVEKRFVRGHIVVTAAVVFRGITMLWSFHLWLPREYCQKNGPKYVKITALAAEMIAAFAPPEGLPVVGGSSDASWSVDRMSPWSTMELG